MISIDILYKGYSLRLFSCSFSQKIGLKFMLIYKSCICVLPGLQLHARGETVIIWQYQLYVSHLTFTPVWYNDLYCACCCHSNLFRDVCSRMIESRAIQVEGVNIYGLLEFVKQIEFVCNVYICIYIYYSVISCLSMKM